MTPNSPIAYSRSELRLRIESVKSLLNQKEKRAASRLLNFLHGRSRRSIRLETYPDKLFRLGLSSYVFEVKFFFKAVKRLVNCSSYHFNSLLAFYVRAGKNSGKKKVIKNIPSAETLNNSIRSFIDKGRYHHAMLLILMFLSGRRAADFKRLKSRDITRLNNSNFSCRLSRDKKHNFTVDFTLSFDRYDVDWCFLEKEQAIEEFLRISQANDIFGPVTLACFARDAGMHPHALRSVRAIMLILEGRTDSEVCADIGWDDCRALRLYSRLPRTVLCSLSWDQILEKLAEVR